MLHLAMVPAQVKKEMIQKEATVLVICLEWLSWADQEKSKSFENLDSQIMTLSKTANKHEWILLPWMIGKWNPSFYICALSVMVYFNILGPVW